jgi:hypothetical protein
MNTTKFLVVILVGKFLGLLWQRTLDWGTIICVQWLSLEIHHPNNVDHNIYTTNIHDNSFVITIFYGDVVGVKWFGFGKNAY